MTLRRLVGAGTALVFAAEPAPSTSCDAEADGYRLVRVLDLPTAANWLDKTPPGAFMVLGHLVVAVTGAALWFFWLA